MKEANEDHLEYLFRSELQHLQEEPDAAVWRGIRGQMASRRKRRAAWIGSGTAMTCLVLGVVAWNAFVGTEPHQSPTAAYVPANAGHDHAMAAPGEEPVSPSGTASIPGNPAGDAIHAPQTEHTTPANPTGLRAEMVEDEIIQLHRGADIHPIIAPLFIADDARTRESVNQIEIPARAEWPALAIAARAFEGAWLPWSPDAQSLKVRRQDLPEKPQAPHWFLEFGFGAAQPHVQTKLNPSIPGFKREVYAQNAGIQHGLYLGYRFSCGWYLRSGLEQIRYGMDARTHYSGMIKEVEYIDAELKTGTVNTYDSTGNQSYHHFRIVRVPLQIGRMHRLGKNWSLDWSLGMSLGRLYRQDPIKSLGNYYSGAELNGAEVSWQTQSVANIGVAYRIHPQISLSGSWTGSWNFNPVYSNSLFSEKHHYSGFRVGINLQLPN